MKRYAATTDSFFRVQSKIMYVMTDMGGRCFPFQGSQYLMSDGGSSECCGNYPNGIEFGGGYNPVVSLNSS